MRNYLDHNLDAIQEAKPEVFEYLTRKAESNDWDNAIVTGVERIEERFVLYAVRDERIFQLDSMYTNDRIVKAFTDNLDGRFNSIFLVFGFGNGMFVREILKKYGPQIRVFIYEPSDSIMQTVIQNTDISDIIRDERVTLLFRGMETDARHLYFYLAEMIEFSDCDGVRVCDYMNYPVLFPSDYQYFKKIIADIRRSIISNRSVHERYGELYVQNTYLNHPYFAKGYSVSSLFGYLPSNIPAIIAAAGPSLKDSFDTLRRIKNSALLIAVDSSIGALLKQDIIPDIFVTVDANKEPGCFSDPRVKDIPIVCVIEARPEALQDHRAPAFFVADTNELISTFMQENKKILPLLSTGGSVANDATSFAETLGLKTIILLGQDLAYVGKETHVEGSLRAGLEIDTDTTKCYTEGLDGQPVKSSYEFTLYREWFEREIRRKPEVTFINSTPRGARIHGAIEMPFEEAVERYCTETCDIAERIGMAVPIYTETEQAQFLSYVEHTITSFRDLNENLRCGINKYNEMINMVIERKHTNPRFKKLYTDVMQISEDVENEPAIFWGLNMIQPEMTQYLKSINELCENEREELLAGIKRGREYAEILRKGFSRAENKLRELSSQVQTDSVECGKNTANACPISRLVSDILNIGNDRNTYLELLKTGVEILRDENAILSESKLGDLQKRIRLTRPEMVFQRIPAALFLYSLTQDSAYLELARIVVAEYNTSGDGIQFGGDFEKFVNQEMAAESALEAYIQFFNGMVS